MSTTTKPTKPQQALPRLGIVNINANTLALPIETAMELTKLLAQAVPVSYRYSDETYEIAQRRNVGSLEILGQDASNKFAMDTGVILANE